MIRETGEPTEFVVPHESPAAEDTVASTRRERLFGRGEGSEPNRETSERPPEVVDRPTEGRRFETDAEAREYGRAQWGETLSSLPPEQVDAVRDYTRQLEEGSRGGETGAIDFREINGALRGRSELTPEVLDHIEKIDAALGAHRTTEALHVTRATGVEHWDFDPADAEGKILTEDSFTSTSLGREADAFKHEPLILDLEVPAGTPALYISGAASEFGESERELLLGRGLRWEVTSIAQDEVTRQWRATGRVVR